MNIEVIYRKYGIVNESQFNNPRLTESNDLNIPLDCIIHAMPYNSNKDGPCIVEPLIYSLAKKNAQFTVDHVLSTNEIYGNPRIVTRSITDKIKEFHKRNKVFRPLRRLEQVLSNKKTCLILNYTNILSILKYPNRTMSSYYLQATFFASIDEQINRYSNKTQRVQFIEIELPKNLKTLADYQSLIRRNIRTTLDHIDKSDYWVLAFVNYLSDKPNINFKLIKDWKNVIFYFTAGNKIAFLSSEYLIRLKESNVRKALRLFYNLIEKMVAIQPKTDDDFDTNLDVIESDINEPIEKEIDRMSETMVSEGVMSDRERTRFLKLSKSYKESPNPLGEGTIETLLEEPTESQISLDVDQLLDSETIIDKSMIKSSLTNFDSKYVNELFQKDVARMIFNFQRAGIAVTNYTIKENIDSATNSFIFKVKLTPLTGKSSTIEFQLPRIQENGTFTINNVVSRLDKQRGDMPIRKIKPNRVSLTSYYGKIFVDRDTKVVNDLGRWITTKIVKIVESEDSPIKSLKVGDVFNPNIKAPRLYSGIAMRIQSFKYKDYEFSFSYNEREKYLQGFKLNDVEKNKRILCGKKGKLPLCINQKNNFSIYNGSHVIVGELDEVLDGLIGNGPIEFATMVNMGKSISLGLLFSYKYGINKLLKLLKANYRIEKTKKVDLTANEFSIRFSDSFLIIERTDPIIDIIMAGFNMYAKDIINYEFNEFNKRDVYLNIISNHSMTIRHLKEIDLIFQLFIDPITLELLKEMKEPTSMDGLFLRTAELLTTDEHPRETDMKYMRIKGYERFSGIMYSELVRSVRGFTNSPDLKGRKIELHPKAVMLDILKDPAISQVNDTNPIQNLREIEKLSYSGLGGRSTKTMVRRTREFHPNDRGIVSEGSTDNSKTGVITYMSADPNINSLRGSVDQLKPNDGVSKQVSTSFLLSPSSDRDEGKRANFIGIQYAHTIAIEGNEIQPIRTGYETVIAHRVDAIYAGVAKEDGMITEINEVALKVKYKDHSEETFKLGKVIGKISGMNLIHEIITDREKGFKFVKNEVLCFNKGFFKRDYFDSKQVCFLMGTVAKVALMEGTDTLEDSCAISVTTSDKLASTKTQIRNIIIDFDQSIHRLVEIGDEVDITTPLCLIEDVVTTGADLFDEKSIATLEILAANSPKAKYKGVIADIKIFYYGEINNMSKNLAKLARRFDKQKKQKLELQDSNEFPTNQLNDSILIENNRLQPNSFVIQIYITSEETMDVGDKGVFANQLKTTVGRVMTGINETESGIPIDAIFGYKSIANRVVLSPQLNGVTTGTLRLISKAAADIYFK